MCSDDEAIFPFSQPAATPTAPAPGWTAHQLVVLRAGDGDHAGVVRRHVFYLGAGPRHGLVLPITGRVMAGPYTGDRRRILVKVVGVDGEAAVLGVIVERATAFPRACLWYPGNWPHTP